MQTATTPLTPAHTVLLQSLYEAGVTEIITDTPTPWFGRPSPAAPTPLHKKEAEKTPRQTPQRQPKPSKPEPKETPIILPEISAALTLTGTPKEMLIITGALHGQGETPFTADEQNLLRNMLKAIHINVDATAVLACSVADATGLAYPDAFKEKLGHAVRTQIKQMTPPALLCLGKVAAQLVTDAPKNLLEAREESQKGQNDTMSPMGTTYHPRHLLKQPQFKRLAWQDLLALQSRLKQGSAHA